tara:strand:+ start:447 stop:1022 length:576 start_codon:yes stop_codon:yes gene_type:complete
MSEKELLSFCRERDALAFDELVDRNKSYIYSWILSKEPNKDRADEIYQRTLIKSWKAIPKFKGDSTYCTWANAIARNLFIDDYKKRERNKEDYYDEVPAYKLPKHEIDSSPTPVEKICNEERKLEVEILLGGLSPAHQIILKFYYADRLSYKEIAEQMDCSIGTVMSRLFYAKRNALKIIRTEKNLERILT